LARFKICFQQDLTFFFVSKILSSRYAFFIIIFFSPKFNLKWGLSQGSALSSDLNLLFISDLILILNEHDVNFYADDGAIALTTPFEISFRES